MGAVGCQFGGHFWQFDFGALFGKKMPVSWLGWFLAYYLVVVGPTWLLSAPRYLLVLLPVPFAAAALCKTKKQDLFGTALCLAVSFLYLLAFVLRWQVW